MKKEDILKIISLGEPTVISIDPDIKTEISRKQIDGIVNDMKKHLSKKKKCHIVLVKEQKFYDRFYAALFCKLHDVSTKREVSASSTQERNQK